MRRTVATSRSNSIGLVSNSLHPAASAFSRSPASAWADSAMTGMSRVCGSPLSLGFPAVHDGHFKIHQDDIGALADRHCAALLAIFRRQHLEVAEQLEPHLEHEDVVIVVFHVKHFGHDAASIPLLTAGFVCTSRRTRSTRSAGEVGHHHVERDRGRAQGRDTVFDFMIDLAPVEGRNFFQTFNVIEGQQLARPPLCVGTWPAT